MCICSLGSETAYTSGTLYDIWDVLWEATEKLHSLEGTATQKKAQKSIAEGFQSSMLERLATCRISESFHDPGIHAKPSFTEDNYPYDDFLAKCKSDSRMFACMLLDPASFHKATERCPVEWKSDLEAFLYKDVLVPRVRVDPTFVAPPQGGADGADGAAKEGGADAVQGGGGKEAKEPTNRKELKAFIKSIQQRGKPRQMAQGLFDEETDELVAAAEKKYAKLKDGGDDSDDEGGGGALDPMAPILDALRKEILLLEGQFKKSRAESRLGTPILPYGSSTLGEGPKARYEFWPSMEDSMPLLSFCAMALLAGSNNATTYNERMHSPAGRIYSKLRSSLKPAKLEHLTLALFYVRRWVEEQMVRGEDTLEMEDLQSGWGENGGEAGQEGEAGGEERGQGEVEILDD